MRYVETNPGLPLTRTISCVCGLAAFAIAIVAGLAADNPADVILSRAIVSMACCAAVGAAVGAVAGVVIEDSIVSHKRAVTATAEAAAPKKASS